MDYQIYLSNTYNCDSRSCNGGLDPIKYLAWLGLAWECQKHENQKTTASFHCGLRLGLGLSSCKVFHIKNKRLLDLSPNDVCKWDICNISVSRQRIKDISCGLQLYNNLFKEMYISKVT